MLEKSVIMRTDEVEGLAYQAFKGVKLPVFLTPAEVSAARQGFSGTGQ